MVNTEVLPFYLFSLDVNMKVRAVYKDKQYFLDFAYFWCNFFVVVPQLEESHAFVERGCAAE